MSARVEKFLSLYQSDNTRRSYRLGLKHFFTSIYAFEKLPPNHELEAIAERYFTKDHDFETDVQTFHTYIHERPPKSVRLFLAAVKIFLQENDVELSQRFWKSISRRIRGTRARTIDRIPSNAELKQISIHLPIQGKTLYLTLASSGMRIGEALQLQLDDIDMTVKPVRISIRGDYTKTGDPRIAFISNEAHEMIKQWLPLREDYLKSAVRKSHRYSKDMKDNRIFPFTESTARVIWNNALDKAGLNGRDKDTRRYRLHPHVLRKFFRTNLAQVIPVDIVEALMGHEGYLTQVYRQYTTEKLAEFYTQGEYVLTVFGKEVNVKQIREEVEQHLKKEIDLQNRNVEQRFQKLYADVTRKNILLEAQIQELQNKVNKVEYYFQRVFGGSDISEMIADLKRIYDHDIQQPLSE